MAAPPPPESPIPEPRQRGPIGRLLAFVAGAALAIIGLGLTALLAPDIGHLGFVLALCGCMNLIMGCFGLDLMIQAARGAPRKAGFFHRALARLAWVRPPALSLGFPLLVAVAIAVSVAAHDADGLTVAQDMGAVWLAFIANVAFHELGHLLAARLAGLTVRRVVIGPLELIRAVGGWQLRVCQDWFSLFAGMVMLDVRRQPSPLQLVAFAAAGPAGSLCLLLLFLVSSPYRWTDLLQVYRPGPALIVVGTFGATLSVVVNLLPIRADPMTGQPNDGYTIRHYLACLRKADAKVA